MSVINIYPEEPCLIPIKFDADPLVIYQKTYADIEEILICLKVKASDADDAYLRLYYKDGAGVGAVTGDVLLDQPSHTFTLNKKETDIVPVGEYGVYIGVQVTGLSKMLWLRVSKNDKVVVSKDGIAQ